MLFVVLWTEQGGQSPVVVSPRKVLLEGYPHTNDRSPTHAREMYGVLPSPPPCLPCHPNKYQTTRQKKRGKGVCALGGCSPAPLHCDTAHQPPNTKGAAHQPLHRYRATGTRNNPPPACRSTAGTPLLRACSGPG